MPDDYSWLNDALDSLARRRPDRWQVSACGVARDVQPIPALLDRDAYAPAASRHRVLLLAGMSAQRADVDLALAALQKFAGDGGDGASPIALSAVPCGNPADLSSGQGRNLATGYPPEDNYFFDPDAPEKRYLWRWVRFLAPDLVIGLRRGEATLWEANAAAQSIAPALQAGPIAQSESLLAALGAKAADGLGPVPALRLTTTPQELGQALEQLGGVLASLGVSVSGARRVLDNRRQRTPLQVARQLAGVYGHHLDPVVYTQGVGISGRLQLAGMDPESRSPAGEIAALVEPYVSGAKPMFGERLAASNLAGLVWGEELSRATGDPRYAGLIVQMAERFQPGEAGPVPPPCDPDFRTEDMFMAGAMLGRAYHITGDARYLNWLARFLLAAPTQQDNGLFWHSRSVPFFWGRGNGFAALGFAETLSYLPDDHPHRGDLLSRHVKHLDALHQLQQPSGMYLQVLDFPGSYQEFTVTCMVGYATARGLGRGWLPPSHRQSLERAWRGVLERLDDGGGVVDACTNTGVQGSLKEYLDRPAVFGFDHRSGGMALWFALEMGRLARKP